MVQRFLAAMPRLPRQSDRVTRSDDRKADQALIERSIRGCVVLRIERVELLIQPVVGGDPGWIAQRTALITGVFMTEPLLQVDLPYP